MSTDEYESFTEDEESRPGTGSSKPETLVRPERTDVDDPSLPNHFYIRKTREQSNHVSVKPSSSGLNPIELIEKEPSVEIWDNTNTSIMTKTVSELDKLINNDSSFTKPIIKPDETDSNENLNFNKVQSEVNTKKKKFLKTREKDQVSIWQLYCYIVTFWASPYLLKLCGMEKRERQMAWREKIGLLSVIIYLGVFISFLTFGFTKTICNDSKLRLKNIDIKGSYIIINGEAYNYNPEVAPKSINIQVTDDFLFGPASEQGKDASFLFQNVNGNCYNLITPKVNSTIPTDENNNLAWYFPCSTFNADGSTTTTYNQINILNPGQCHLSDVERQRFYSMKSIAEIFYTWDEIKSNSRNLVVYNGNVLDLDLLDQLEKNQLNYPNEFDELKELQFRGYDISLIFSNKQNKIYGRCLTEIVKVGVIDSQTVGCLASEVVLYTSLVIILSVVILKFLGACYFSWAVAKKQGAYQMDNKTMEKHTHAIEDWSRDINSMAVIQNVEPSLRPRKDLSKLENRFNSVKGHSSLLLMNPNPKLLSVSKQSDGFSKNKVFNGMTNMSLPYETSSTEVIPFSRTPTMKISASNKIDGQISKRYCQKIMHQNITLSPSKIHPNIIIQPSVSFQPYKFPLLHTICFVTCYSEDEIGLRTTLDSISTTDYPNSHKLIMIVCDGLIKGSGNQNTTPEIVLGMMEDFIVSPEEALPYSYVAVASGKLRHNMAKVHSGFYRYDIKTVPREKQQRVPIITIVKCGTPEEFVSNKPGNRGKRDSQVILMSFLQKVTFDERMTELEYQLLKHIWRITGLMSNFYEAVLMVDADTKVFPDSLTHMVAELVKDPLIMGLCGETKIANKCESWVSAIQVFEYYISHHQIKAFESIFGSVTCLPGCFSIYRIKAPKGSDGYWVPILANPDIVERYSDNDISTLHKKNLLLLGEDRYLSSLMLKTFPKRKQIFVPKAACKTVVPSKFNVLLSQRRRWINSTVHNLFEVILIRDLCGTFCFSMQFVVGIELIGTLVLPLAICFTIYVIIISIFSDSTPIVTLILLALILGLPGLLVIVTVTRWSYLVWLLIYIIALPIWNFVLPSYAYWKFDDFTWGDTRKIADDGCEKESHEESTGEFEHSMITMRTWNEFERREKPVSSIFNIRYKKSRLSVKE